MKVPVILGPRYRASFRESLPGRGANIRKGTLCSSAAIDNMAETTFTETVSYHIISTINL